MAKLRGNIKDHNKTISKCIDDAIDMMNRGWNIEAKIMLIEIQEKILKTK